MVWMQGCVIQVVFLGNKWVGIGIAYETPVLANHSLEEKAEGLWFLVCNIRSSKLPYLAWGLLTDRTEIWRHYYIFS